MKAALNLILANDRLTRGLGDAEARRLIDWLVEHAERLHEDGCPPQALHAEITRRCQQARAVGRFIALWCYEHQRGPAIQLAATERFSWPLPTREMDPYDLLSEIVDWEDAHLPERSEWAA